MRKQIKYPVTEIFNTLQGEGAYSGTPMTFIRMAGCSVGTMISIDSPYEKCTTWDGREFVCDTNYRMTDRYDIDSILQSVPANGTRCLITGGEPLIHNLIHL